LNKQTSNLTVKAFGLNEQMQEILGALKEIKTKQNEYEANYVQKSNNLKSCTKQTTSIDLTEERNSNKSSYNFQQNNDLLDKFIDLVLNLWKKKFMT